MNTPTLYHRHGLGQFLLDAVSELPGHGVEIGCAFGGFSERILEQWPGTLHLVDPWLTQDPAIYRERSNREVNFQTWFEEAKRRLAPFGHRAQFHRMFSVEGSKLFADESLDFVYIDGNHSFEAVTEDILHWFPKVRPGGLVSGHDYYNATTEGHWCLVKDAVDKWAAERNIPVRVTASGCSSWYFIKP